MIQFCLHIEVTKSLSNKQMFYAQIKLIYKIKHLKKNTFFSQKKHIEFIKLKITLDRVSTKGATKNSQKEKQLQKHQK